MSSDQNKTILKLFGMSFWQRHWGLTVGLLTLPLSITSGLITSSYPFNISEISTASQMLVGFASFLSAAWTFGLSYFWPATEREARKIRKQLLELNEKKATPKGLDLPEVLRGLKMPFWTFLLAVSGLILMIWSVFLAVGATLFSFPALVLFSIWAIAAGSTIMIGTWVQLYVIRETLGMIAEIRILPSKDPPMDQ